MARGMNDGIYNHRVANYPEDDSVGKPMRVSPTHLLATRTNLVNKRIGGQTVHRVSHCPKELATQSNLLLLVPSFCFNQVGIHFRTNNQSVAHSSSFQFNRALTSSQGTAVPGFFS